MDWEGIGAGGWWGGRLVGEGGGGGRRLVGQEAVQGATLKTRLRSFDFTMSETGSKDSVSTFLFFQDNG